jgi:hypothetical protein
VKAKQPELRQLEYRLAQTLAWPPVAMQRSRQLAQNAALLVLPQLRAEHLLTSHARVPPRRAHVPGGQLPALGQACA